MYFKVHTYHIGENAKCSNKLWEIWLSKYYHKSEPTPDDQAKFKCCTRIPPRVGPAIALREWHKYTKEYQYRKWSKLQLQKWCMRKGHLKENGIKVALRRNFEKIQRTVLKRILLTEQKSRQANIRFPVHTLKNYSLTLGWKYWEIEPKKLSWRNYLPNIEHRIKNGGKCTLSRNSIRKSIPSKKRKTLCETMISNLYLNLCLWSKIVRTLKCSGFL